jgi:hypothetical protein
MAFVPVSRAESRLQSWTFQRMTGIRINLLVMSMTRWGISLYILDGGRKAGKGGAEMGRERARKKRECQ